MTRFADPSVCPDCGTPLPADPLACPHCALPLQGPLAVSLFRTLSLADRLLAELRASADVPAPVAPARVTSPAAAEPYSRPTGSSDEPRRTGVRGASVASILLGLGALCLLVAAVIFLAVAWSWLGVGGRTVVLVALTITAATLGTWLSRRGLRLAAESLTLVSLGLLALDALGAENAGWLGQLSTAGTVSLVGATLLAGALALVLVSGRLVTPQVVSVIGLWTLVAGVSGQTAHDQVVLVLGVLAFACLAEVGRLRGVTALPWLALVGAGTWWAALLLVALSDAADHATVHAMWAQGHGVGLLAASALLLLPIPFSAARSRVRQACAAAAATLATVALALPGMDDGATTVAWVSLVLLLLWSGAALVLGERWKAVALAPMALSAVPVSVIAAYLLVEAAANTLAVGDPFTRTAGVRLPSLSLDAEPALSVPCVVGLLVAAAVATSVATSVTTSAGRRVVVPGAASVVALAAIATLALHTVPLWTVTAATSLVAAALVADAVRRTDRAGSVEAAGGGLVALLAIAFALPSAVLCTGATAVLVLAAAAVAVAGRFPDARVAAWTVLPAATAGLIWSGAEVAAVDTAYRAAPVLIVVGLMAILRPRIEVEASAAVAGLVASAAAVPAATDPTWSLSLHLTLAGALVTASALVTPSRRSLGWLGGALLAAATWVRLAEIGVHAPEAYTLPSALALLLVGLRRLRHDPDATTMTALAPGLVLATVPSLLWVVAGDAVSLRAALLGLGCLALVLVGVRLRWNAPLLIGSSVGALLVLRELAPYAGHTPQWVLIGFAGTVLTLVGITWENRMLELRHAAAYLGRLR